MANVVQNNKQFSLAVDEKITHKLSDFCRQVGISQSSTVRIAINYFFDDPKLIHSLMDGYREMGNLNRELTHDFWLVRLTLKFTLPSIGINTTFNYFGL